MRDSAAPDNLPLPYRQCVGIMVLNSNNQVFMGKRLFDHNSKTKDCYWQMPQGGIDEGEEEIPAALRELKEETGITQGKLIAQSNDLYQYDFPAYVPQRNYRGQQQRWFVFRFEGNDADICLIPDSSNGTNIHQEFSEWKWYDADQIEHLVIPFKREVYREAVREFKSYLI